MKKLHIISFTMMLLLAANGSAQTGNRTAWYNKVPDKWQFFAGADIGFPETGMKNPAYGINVGYVKEFGVYARAMLNGRSLDTHKVYSWYPQELGYDYYITGKYKHIYQTFMAGGMLRLWSPAYLHIGAGYVTNQTAYELMDGKYIHVEGDTQHNDWSDSFYQGIGFEAGLSLRINDVFIHTNCICANSDLALSCGISYCF